jgi:cell division protein FtsA
LFANNANRGSLSRHGLVTALDIGSSKIACLIGDLGSKGLRVVGAALRESHGVQHGAIIDLGLAEQAIRETVAGAEAQADARIQDVSISVNCSRPANLSSTVSLSVDGHLIADKHLKAAIREASSKLMSEGHTTIQRAVTSYALDDVQNVSTPIGMYGERLEVTLSALAFRNPPLANLVLAAERASLFVSGALFASYASALAVLTEDDMQLGTIVLDMGSGTTSIAVLRKGRLVHADWVPLGGNIVTTDVASVLGTSIATAERVKCLFGEAMPTPGDAEYINMPKLSDNGGAHDALVPRALLSQIIQARLEEIFGLVQKRLKTSGFEMMAGTEIVLTGGACQQSKVSELAAQVFKIRVRIARPRSLVGWPDSHCGPEYAAAIGLLLAGANWPPEMLVIQGLGEAEAPYQKSSKAALFNNLLGFRKPRK